VTWYSPFVRSTPYSVYYSSLKLCLRRAVASTDVSPGQLALRSSAARLSAVVLAAPRDKPAQVRLDQERFPYVPSPVRASGSRLGRSTRCIYSFLFPTDHSRCQKLSSTYLSNFIVIPLSLYPCQTARASKLD